MAIFSGKPSEKSINISKGILYGFFTFFLVFYGVILTVFIQEFGRQHPGIFPYFVNYFPLVCYIAAIFMGLRFLIFIRNKRTRKVREKRSRKKLKKGSVYRKALFLIIFIFSFVPLLSPVIDQGKNDHNFSAYNEGWNGGSDFKALVEDEGYETYNVQSSLSATQRLNKSMLLVLFGPNQFYNPIYEIPFFINFFENNNSLLLLHDFGSTSALLWEIFAANLADPNVKDKTPVTIFPDGVLRDNESCLVNEEGKKDPQFPVVTNFQSHPTTEGVNNVLLARASAALGGPFLEYFGWNPIAYTSMYSFIDKNEDGVYNIEDDNIDLSFIDNVIGEDFPLDLSKFPLGGYPQTPFMSKQADNVRLFVSGDASLFNNDLLNREEFDNARFARNIINWLTYENGEDWIVVFDEAHIRPEYSRDLSSAGIFGFIIQYVVHLSTNPITAWIYPLLAIYLLRKYLPKKKEKEREEKEKQEEEKRKFRTSSFFARKIKWYRSNQKFDKALLLLYRRLERKLNAQLGGKNITTENVINMVSAKVPNISKQKLKRIGKFMNKILAIKKNELDVQDQKDFENLFFEMEWVMENI
ncbi:MAG: hypothetical protein R6U96_12955 [Promethearchaeia archaeon]